MSKSRTIKIDIRPQGISPDTATSQRTGGPAPDYFSTLDYRFLFEHAYDTILLADPSGHILASNSRAKSFFGYEEDGVVGLNVRMLIAGITEKLLTDLHNAIKDGLYMRIQAFALHHNQSILPVEIVALGNRVNAPNLCCYLVRDIESRWQAEQRLLSAHHAMDNTDSGIGIADLNATITYANRFMISTFGQGNEDKVIGKPLNTWFDQATLVKPMLSNITNGRGWTGEQRLIHEGNVAWLAISAVPDVDEEGAIRGVVLSFRDVADRRRAELAEYQAERNRVMAESMAGVCHALGQPATILMSSLELLKMNGVKDHEQAEQMIELCYEAVTQLRELMQQMNTQANYDTEPYLPRQSSDHSIVKISPHSPSADPP